MPCTAWEAGGRRTKHTSPAWTVSSGAKASPAQSSAETPAETDAGGIGNAASWWSKSTDCALVGPYILCSSVCTLQLAAAQLNIISERIIRTVLQLNWRALPGCCSPYASLRHRAETPLPAVVPLS